MRTICLDLRALQIGHENRGIGMHIRSILENLPESEDRYLFYCFDQSNPIEELGIKTKANYIIVQTPTINTVLDSPQNAFGIFKLVWHRFLPLKKHNPDTFVQFDFMLGLPRWRGVKKVMIGYDLIPLIMRNDYLPSMRYAWNHTRGKKQKIKAVMRSLYYQFRHWLHYRTYKRADKIVCISEASAKSFNRLLGIQKSRLAVSYLAPVANHADIDESTAKSVDKPYLFYIGGADKRKSLADLVAAYNIARGRGVDVALVLAGNEFKNVENIPDVTGRNAILASPYMSDIHTVGFITDGQKRGLYKNASAFIFCSKFEGFGLPVVEAQAEGCPVIAYNNSSIPEVSSDDVLLVESGNYLEIAKSITNFTRTAPNVKKGIDFAKRFTWINHVKILLETI